MTTGKGIISIPSLPGAILFDIEDEIITLAGFPAYSLVFSLKKPEFDQKQFGMFVFTKLEGMLYEVTFLVSEDDYYKYSPTVQEIINSLHI